MIQRFQTVFLFLAACLTGAQYLVPFAQIPQIPADADLGKIFADGQLTLSDSSIFMGFPIISAIFCLIAIFRYQNRPRQISTTTIAIAGLVVALVGTISVGYNAAQTLPQGTGLQISWGGLLSALALLCMFLAIFFIRKDEKLVRNSDKLR